MIIMDYNFQIFYEYSRQCNEEGEAQNIFDY